MLRQMARKADQLAGERDRLPDRGIGRIETGLADVSVGQAVVAAIAPHRLGQSRGDVFGQSQNLADLADGAARTVMNDGGADRGAMAAVAPIDVLDHFLAPLVLEIDVDIGRLAAVRGNEAGEQQLAFVRIDLGDAEAEAHRAVGGGAAALAENILLLARIGDHVMHGEKIMRVFELLDQRQFVLQPFDDLGAECRPENAPWDSAWRRRSRSRSVEMLLRGLARRHRLVGIFVFEFAERETAGLRDLDGAGDGVGEIFEQPRHFGRRLDVALGIDGEPEAGFARACISRARR